MHDVPHHQCTVERRGAGRKVSRVVEKARSDTLDCERLDAPLGDSELQAVITAGMVRRGIAD